MIARNSMSHWICDPKKDEFEQLVNPADSNARSLRNLADGVETNNRGGVYQLEIVGYAAEVPKYNDDWYRWLGNVVTSLSKEWGFPLRFPYEFDGSSAYGTRGSVRLTNQEWLNVSGIIGHQHVPENTHWDPGKIDKLEQYVGGRVEPISSGFKYLKLGAEGAAVGELQKLCNLINNTKIWVDNDFGGQTRDAVDLLQRNVGLTGRQVDGVYGPQTFEAARVKILQMGAVLEKIRPNT